MTDQGRQTIKLVQKGILIAIVVAFIIMVQVQHQPDPRINMKSLGGLTPNQVLARLGPPTSQLQTPWPTANPLNPEDHSSPQIDSTLFFYSGSFPHANWYRFAVIFQGGHVVQVTCHRK
jgi:hypothetical protein